MAGNIFLHYGSQILRYSFKKRPVSMCRGDSLQMTVACAELGFRTVVVSFSCWPDLNWTIANDAVGAKWRLRLSVQKHESNRLKR